MGMLRMVRHMVQGNKRTDEHLLHNGYQFTAPRSGTYRVSYHMMVRSAATFKLKLFKDYFPGDSMVMLHRPVDVSSNLATSKCIILTRCILTQI